MTGGTVVFGGSFDPIHVGHVSIARAVLDVPGWNRVVFVPAGQNPLKGNAPVARGVDRMAMVELAIAGEPRFESSDIELNRAGPSYTIDTVRAFLRRDAGPVGLLVGDDLLRQMGAWRDSDELFNTVHLFVATRNDGGADHEPARFKAGVTYLENYRFVVSSSAVRAALRGGSGATTVERLVPAPVAAYIAERALYA